MVQRGEELWMEEVVEGLHSGRDRHKSSVQRGLAVEVSHSRFISLGYQSRLWRVESARTFARTFHF